MEIVLCLGLLAGTFIYIIVTEGKESITISGSYLQIIFAGLLVGFGTRLGSGCTSGHGICGIARFSVRSILSTILFMATAIITVLIVKQF